DGGSCRDGPTGHGEHTIRDGRVVVEAHTLLAVGPCTVVDAERGEVDEQFLEDRHRRRLVLRFEPSDLTLEVRYLVVTGRGTGRVLLFAVGPESGHKVRPRHRVRPWVR